MLVKRIKSEKYNLICKGCHYLSLLETGCRIQEESYNNMVINQIERNSLKSKELSCYNGKKVKIIYCYKENIGNKTYPHMITAFDVEYYNKLKITDKTICEEDHNTKRHKHSQIIAIMED